MHELGGREDTGNGMTRPTCLRRGAAEVFSGSPSPLSSMLRSMNSKSKHGQIGGKTGIKPWSRRGCEDAYLPNTIRAWRS